MAPSAVEVEKVVPVVTRAIDKEPKSSKSPLPIVKKFDATTVTVDELVDALTVAGGVIVRNLLTEEELDQIEADVRPWLDKDKPWKGTSEQSSNLDVKLIVSQVKCSHKKHAVPMA